MRTIATAGNLLMVLLMATCAAGQTKPIPIGVKVEAEGEGKARGMWTQAANDLPSKEIKTLETLVVAELKKQGGIDIVPLDDAEDYIGIAVVASKLPSGKPGEWHYIASSVVIVATKKGTDELLTHDVIAEHDLPSLARAIGLQFAFARLRAAAGLWK